jgi:hypothetical protein
MNQSTLETSLHRARLALSCTPPHRYGDTSSLRATQEQVRHLLRSCMGTLQQTARPDRPSCEAMRTTAFLDSIAAAGADSDLPLLISEAARFASMGFVQLSESFDLSTERVAVEICPSPLAVTVSFVASEEEILERPHEAADVKSALEARSNRLGAVLLAVCQRADAVLQQRALGVQAVPDLMQGAFGLPLAAPAGHSVRASRRS